MKKYYFLFMIILLSVFLSLLSIKNVYANLPLSGIIIVIDPGHGGKDPGTTSGKIYEKDINLKISLELEKEINKLGGTVLLTRNNDYDLSSPGVTWRKKSDFDNRIDLINKSKANLYLSVHLNYLNDSKYYGPQVFYNENSKRLANIIQDFLNHNLNNNRKIKKIPDNTYMYSKLLPHGVLIECGFLSNENEREKLSTSEYQKKIANLIAKSLVQYF